MAAIARYSTSTCAYSLPARRFISVTSASSAPLLFRGSDKPSKSQSTVLSRGQEMFQLEVHTLKPKYKAEYLQEAGKHMRRVHDDKEVPVELIGSWTTVIGPNTDEVTHLWKFNGYDGLTAAMKWLQADKEWQAYLCSQGGKVYSRSSQIVMAFTYWPPIVKPRPQGRMYEMRSYNLKPGSLIEWGEWWSQGIRHRSEDEAVGGWFSQLGKIHQVHHMWTYKDLAERKEVRQSAWEGPGWDECVRRTVPLIQEMQSRILVATDFSPMK